MLGFFFANQDKIKKFIDDENEQKMMTKLRTQYETIDSRTKKFVQGEVIKYREEIEACIPEIFGRNETAAVIGSTTIPRRRRNDDAEERVKQLSNYAMKDTVISPPTFPSRLSNTPKHEIFDIYNQFKMSGAKVEVELSPSMMNAGIKGRERYSPLRSGGLASSNYASKNNRMGEITRAQFEAERTLEKFESNLARREEKKGGTPGRGGLVEKPGEDPMVSIQKKLDMFDIKVSQKRCIVLGEPRIKEWRMPLEMHREPRSDPNTLMGLENDRAPNIENLRMFRQKMRERYSKEPVGSLRNRSIYTIH